MNTIIGCTTFVLIVLICNIKVIFKKKYIAEVKIRAINALKEINIKELESGIKTIDIDGYENVLGQDE